MQHNAVAEENMECIVFLYLLLRHPISDPLCNLESSVYCFAVIVTIRRGTTGQVITNAADSDVRVFLTLILKI